MSMLRWRRWFGASMNASVKKLTKCLLLSLKGELAIISCTKSNGTLFKRSSRGSIARLKHSLNRTRASLNSNKSQCRASYWAWFKRTLKRWCKSTIELQLASQSSLIKRSCSESWTTQLIRSHWWKLLKQRLRRRSWPQRCKSLKVCTNDYASSASCRSKCRECLCQVSHQAAWRLEKRSIQSCKGVNICYSRVW